MNSSKNNIEDQAVIFLHIPKAAGSTLHRIIEQQYEQNTIFSINEERTVADFKNLSQAQRAALRVLKGHMYFGLHEFLPQPSTYITILRDPIERVISHYYYVLREPRNELHESVKSQNMSLKDFVSSGIYLHIDNGQTRLLSTTGASYGYGQCDKEMLESAKENIRKHFLVVGLAERFDETLILIKRAFDWKIMPYYIKENVTKDRPVQQNISKDTLEVIKKYNELDIELYNYMQTVFEDKINQQELNFETELKTLKLLNPIYRSCSGGTVSTNNLTDSGNSFSLQTTELPELIAIPGVNDIKEIKFIAASKNKPSGFFDEVNGSSAKTIEVANATPITASGWAILADEGRIADMVIITCGNNNSLIALAPVNWKRPDVVDFLKNTAYNNCGWMTTFNSSTLPAGKVVLLAWAYNSTRKEATQLNSKHEVVLKKPAKSLQVELEQLQTELQQTQGKWEQSQAQLLQTQADLERLRSQLGQTQIEKERSQSQLQQIRAELERSQATISGMESSKFWKLRTTWFQIKEAIGLTDSLTPISASVAILSKLFNAKI